MKSRIVFEFLLSRRTETYRIRAFSWDQKANSTKSMHICMPHYSGGDNATKVRRRSTCRNSFRDVFLHDLFAHHLKHALRFLVLLKRHPGKKPVWFQRFLQLFSQALECLITNNKGSRCLCDVPQTSKNSPVFWLTFFFSICWTHCALFYVFPRLFLCSFSFEKNNLLQGTDHSSQWNQSL